MTDIHDSRRAALLDMIADHLLAAGLGKSSLRLLAAACRTSDRMLLYYFADKDSLMVAALQAISLRLVNVLTGTLSPGVSTGPEAALWDLAGILRGDEVRPYMQLWLELAALAGRGEEPFLTVAGQMADGFLAWIASRMAGADEAARMAAAAQVVALLDGLVVLDAAGRPGIAGLALQGRGTGAGIV